MINQKNMRIKILTRFRPFFNFELRGKDRLGLITSIQYARLFGSEKVQKYADVM